MMLISGGLPVSAVVVPGSILTLLLVRFWTLRTQKKARLEMKRHLQKMDAPESA